MNSEVEIGAGREIDIMKFVDLVWRRKFFILFFAIIAMAFCYAYIHYFTVKKYTSQSVIMLESRSENVADIVSA